MNEEPTTTNNELSVYLNEWDAFPAQWLRNQFPDAVVDETSIVALNRPADEYGPYLWGVPVEHDLSQYRQVHFFAGIGGWPEALRLAGWPESVPIWTGSCPCQPFSSAGDQKGFSDDRDLWPDMFRQIRRFRPAFVVGEQVANGTLPLAWLDRVFADLESEGYACWAVDLPAASVGSPIIRQRLFWGAVRLDQAGDWRREAEAIPEPYGERRCSSGGERWDTRGTDHREHDGSQPSAADFRSPLTVPGSEGGGQRRGTGAGGSDGPQAGHGGSSGVELERSPSDGRQPRRAPSDGRLVTSRCGSVRDVALPDGVQLQGQPSTGEQPVLEQGAGTDEPSGRHVGVPSGEGLSQRAGDGGVQPAEGLAHSREAVDLSSDSGPQPSTLNPQSFWSPYSIISFRDGKQRRIEPGTEPLAHGIPKGNAWSVPRLAQLGFAANHAKQLVALARTNRVGTLRGYGNAIVPQAAAVFLRVWMDVLGIEPTTRNEEP